MIYHFKTSKKFDKDFKKLDKSVQKLLKGWINKNLINTTQPRELGKKLKGNLQDQWRYRVGDYRILCIINDDEFIINALEIGHRKKIYKKK